METTETFWAYGHANILATNRTTLEITKDPHLSKKGDCIIAISADKTLASLRSSLKDGLRKKNAKLTILVEIGEIAEVVNACGTPKLILTHPTDMVIRKSDYICNRTLAIKADKAAYDLPRMLVKELRNPEQKVKITLAVRS